MSNFPFDLRTQMLGEPPDQRCAMIMMPRGLMRVGRDRLERIEQADSINDVERRLVQEVRSRQVTVVLFRATDDEGASRWEFDPSLTEDELEQAGEVMALGLLPLYRRFAASGVVLHFHCGWALPECSAMRQGVLAATTRRTSEADPLTPLDCWILRHMVQHVALSYEHVIRELIPLHLPTMERRGRKLRSIVEASPVSYE